MKFDIKDLSLATEGKKLIAWATNDMPVLNLLRIRFQNNKSLKNVKLVACAHVTSETANLMITLKSGGAEVALAASNPLSTNDAVAAALVKHYDIPVFAIKGEDNKTYYSHLNAILDYGPNLVMDDGADLVNLLHGKRSNLISNIVGSTEETTTGVIRLRAMAKKKVLKIPALAVNDNMTKHLFDNRYGTGQSTIDAIIRATNILLAGRTFVVCGYGWCGRGVAMRAAGMGAVVIVCEVDPIKALEAKMDGYSVMPLREAIKKADFVLSTTGNKHVVDEEHLKLAKDKVILAQSGHFDVEINKDALKRLSSKITRVRRFVDEYRVAKKRIYLLGEGRLVNLVAADGHPASVMDMSFAGQALGSLYMWENRGKLIAGVHLLPRALDEQIAKLKLQSDGVQIDKLTKEQIVYSSSWNEGT